MNPNDNDDAKLIAQIDRRIQDDQPSGIPLVDELAAAIPQPRPDFQQQLEDRLAAHYHLPQNGKGELELVTHTPILDTRPQKKWAFIPLTLAAAMLAVVIIGSIILTPNRGGSQGGLAVGLQTTLSPTPVGTVLPNPAPVMGCDTPNATLVVPINGMVVFEPINVIGTAFTDNFGFYRFELNGPSTSGNFAMIRDYNQPIETIGELGQFVPSFYEPGDYEFRLVVFATDNSLRAACTINITISEPIPTPTPIIPTQTPVPLVNIVIALQDLPSGYRFPSTMEELAKVVSYAPWPVSDIPPNVLSEDGDGLDALIGKVLRAEVVHGQPIPANQIVDDLGPIGAVSSDISAMIPQDKVAITIPLSLLVDMPDEAKVGDLIDLSAVVSFIDTTNTQSTVMDQKIVRGAVVAHIGDFPPSASTLPPDIITLSVFPDEAETLVGLIEAQIPLTVELFPQSLDSSTAVTSEAELIPTLTPAPFVNVVIALQDLPRGYKFPATIDELAGVAGYYPWPESVVAPGMLREDQQGLERLLGQELSWDVFREQPLISNLFVGGLGESIFMPRNFLPGVAVPNVPLVNVIVALQDLPRGYQFPMNIADLDNIVDYMTLPESVISLDALREDQNGLQQLSGRMLKTEVYSQQPILQSLLAEEVTQLTDIGNMTNFGIPSGQASILLPVSISEVIASGIRERDYVDLVVSMLFVDADETFQTVQPPGTVMDVLSSLDDNPPCPSTEPCTVTQTVVQNAMILNIEESHTDMMVTLIVSPQDMPVINWILEAKLPYILRRTIPESVQLPDYPDQIPTGMWLSEIPIEQIQSVASPIQQGDLVDISFSFLWQDVQPDMSNTISPENGRVFTVTLLQGVKVYKLGESIGGDKNDIVTLLLSEEDMALLSALLKTTVPFAITLTPSNQAGLFAPYATNDQLILEIPTSNLTGTENLMEASNRVNILAQVEFNGYDPTNPNSFQLQGRNSVAQMVAHDVEIVGFGEDVYKVAITLDDLPNLQWALKAGLPLTVQLSE
jgi:Flp pilus assembly protein CpaB